MNINCNHVADTVRNKIQTSSQNFCSINIDMGCSLILHDNYQASSSQILRTCAVSTRLLLALEKYQFWSTLLNAHGRYTLSKYRHCLLRVRMLWRRIQRSSKKYKKQWLIQANHFSSNNISHFQHNVSHFLLGLFCLHFEGSLFI